MDVTREIAGAFEPVGGFEGGVDRPGTADQDLIEVLHVRPGGDSQPVH
jgi:hypothetical protein